LFAGGLAAVYFTTYAAHHIPNLRIIENALLDGALLLGWAAFMVWIADRKQSEVLALFAVGLAYYTSVITRVGAFTLYSNLILTGAAVFFLVRNRWAVLSIASLMGTYGSYAFWRFFDGAGWRWASPSEGLWFGAYFLVSYWCLFTAAVFLSKSETLQGPPRAGFLTVNNGAFFSLFLLTMLQVRSGGFWKVALVFGAALLACAELSRRRLPDESLTRNSYLTQGLLLVTLGIIAKFAGLQLALLLAAESVVLLSLGLARRNVILQTGAYLSGALAVGWGIDGLQRDHWPTLLMAVSLGLLMLANAVIAHRHYRENPSLIRPVPAFFSILALVSGAAAIAYNAAPLRLPPVFALACAGLTFSIYALRLREFSLFAQGYLLIAQALWLAHTALGEKSPPWWNPAIVIGVTLLLSHWWASPRVIPISRGLSRVAQTVYGLAFVAVLYCWLEPKFLPSTWMAITAGLALVLTCYAWATRALILGLCAQLLLGASVIMFIMHRAPHWYQPFVPMLVLALGGLGTLTAIRRATRAEDSQWKSLLQLARIYRWTAALMLLWWVQEYVPARERIWVCAGWGALAFVTGGWKRNSELLLMSALFTVTSLALFWSPLHPAPKVYWPNLAALIVLLLQQRLARRFADRFQLDERLHTCLILLGGVSLWLLLTRWINQYATGFYVTASWSGYALAIFMGGIAFRERVYRWLGLAVLGGALARVVLFDVWKLETIYRILSFMALGIVLLVLGFIYNRYQDKFRSWLR